MNKDVIYIEPEDDITDIILKIENSKEKIVACGAALKWLLSKVRLQE